MGVDFNNVPCCNAMVFVTDDIIKPKNKTLFEIIKSQSRFSRFVQMVEGTSLEIILKNTSKTVTALIVTDDTMGQVIFENYLANKDQYLKVLSHHIIKGNYKKFILRQMILKLC